MAYLHDIINGLFDEIGETLEAMDPNSKPSERFRRHTEQARQLGSISETVGRPRLFEFDRESIISVPAMAGSGTVHYVVGFPILVTYPTASGWHAAAMDDWTQLFGVLADNATTVPGVCLREIDLTATPVNTKLPNDPWIISRWMVRANVDADV